MFSVKKLQRRLSPSDSKGARTFPVTKLQHRQSKAIQTACSARHDGMSRCIAAGVRSVAAHRLQLAGVHAVIHQTLAALLVH